MDHVQQDLLTAREKNVRLRGTSRFAPPGAGLPGRVMMPSTAEPNHPTGPEFAPGVLTLSQDGLTTDSHADDDYAACAGGWQRTLQNISHDADQVMAGAVTDFGAACSESL